MRRSARALMVLGVVASVAGWSKIHAANANYDWSESGRFAWSLAYVGVLLVASYGLGFPELRRSRREAYQGALGVATVAAVAISLAQLVVGDALLPRFVVFGAAAVMVPTLAFCGRLASLGTSRAETRDRVVLVAHPSDQARLGEELERVPERPASVVAALTPAQASTATASAPLLVAAREQRANVVVLCRDAQVDESVVAQAGLLHEKGARVRTLSLFYEEWLGKLPVSELERVSLMFDIGEVHRRRYVRAKRVADVLIGLVGCVALVLLVPIVALANVAGNRGPLLYRQERVGKHGRRFQILKFRTMRPGDFTTPASWTTDGDPRVTPVGRWMRRSHLDEMPQMLNILRGDLSIVGPRPEQPHYVAELARKLPFYDLRHLVRPGLTGWAQVKYGYAGDERDALEKLQYEFYYLRHQGVRMDTQVAVRTIRSILGHQGT